MSYMSNLALENELGINKQKNTVIYSSVKTALLLAMKNASLGYKHNEITLNSRALFIYDNLEQLIYDCLEELERLDHE